MRHTLPRHTSDAPAVGSGDLAQRLRGESRFGPLPLVAVGAAERFKKSLPLRGKCDVGWQWMNRFGLDRLGIVPIEQIRGNVDRLLRFKLQVGHPPGWTMRQRLT